MSLCVRGSGCRWRSTEACQPGGTTVVASNCSTMAGPAKPCADDQACRDRKCVASSACRASKNTRRVPLIAAAAAATARRPARPAAGISAPRRARAGDSSRPRRPSRWRRGREFCACTSSKRCARAPSACAVERVLPQPVERHAQLVALAGIAHVEIALEHGGARVEAFFGKLGRRLGLDLAENLPRRGPDRAGRARRVRSGCNRAARRCRASPSAENAPGRAGTMMRRMPSSSATAAACTAPAPPNGNSANSPRSTPRRAANTRTSSAMRMSTMRRMPAAASATLIVIGLAILASSAARAASASSFCAAAEEIIRIEEAADDVGVGHGRIVAAAAVAHRARIGAGALRADGEKAGAVDPHDRAAAGRDRGEIERRNVELAARHDAFGHFERRAAFDEGDVATGAAHVERDDAAPRRRRAADRRSPARPPPGPTAGCARSCGR